MGRKNQHRFHGSIDRFENLAEYINIKYGRTIKYIADVAGGQGMLTRILRKQYHYESEVIDPRGYTLIGVPNRPLEFTASMASYYDLIVGLHPDEATKAIAEASLIKPTIIIPCCNFWSQEKLGRDALIESIENYLHINDVNFERLEFEFKGPRNIGLVTKPR